MIPFFARNRCELRPGDASAHPPITGWIRFLIQAQKDLRLWMMLVTFMGLMRLGILLAFFGRWEQATGLKDLVAAISRGARFDMQVATFWCLISVLVSAACGLRDWAGPADRLRRLLAVVFVGGTTLVMAVDVGFFREYHAQFNHFIFGAVYDDRTAILSTIWASYHPLPTLGVALAVGLAVGWLTVRAVERPFVEEACLARCRWSLLQRILTGAALVVVIVTVGRGRATSRPLKMGDAAVVADRCLSAWIPTPFHSLSDAYGNWKRMQGVSGLTVFIPDGDLGKAAAEALPEVGRQTRIDDYLDRSAPGTRTPPRHVFLIIMESYDAWPLLERWRPLHLTDHVAALGAEGILVTDFLPIGTGTMSSLAGILTGLPDVGVYTAFRPSARQPFSTSPAAIFKRLGYRTRFFYSGFLSWQHIGEFCASQGFEDVYGGGHIGNPEGKDWGVDDEDLFSYALQSVTDDRPSFNVILTTSNHPPYQVDVDRKGFPMDEIPSWTGYDPAGDFNRRILGHLWYSDRCAGDFIRAVEAKLPRTVVALTGDHWSRRSITARPTFYERSAVPLLLHGPEVLAGVSRPPHLAGGHLDIAPTLIELCAPQGFVYPALGENLLRPRHHWGLGWNRMIGPGFMLEMTAPKPTLFPASGTQPQVSSDPESMASWYRTAYGLGWWRLMRGPELEAKGEWKHPKK